VQLGKGNLFTYDYVFDTEEIQTNIYEACVSQLVEGALEGYNATVLAYGQVRSTKFSNKQNHGSYHPKYCLKF
jgi:kinesin family member 21